MMTDTETESSNGTSFRSRRVLLMSGFLAFINVPVVSLPRNRGYQKPISFSFEGPFLRGEKHFFVESARKKLPFIPLNLQVGNNDIAFWYGPLKTEHIIKRLVTLDLYGENDQVVSSQSSPMRVDGSQDDIFRGGNVLFRVPKATLSKAPELIIKFGELC